MIYEIPFNYPYSFFHTVRRLSLFEKSIYLHRNGTFYRTVQLKEQPFVIGVSLSANQQALRVETNRELSTEEKAWVRKIWSTEVDLTPFYERWSEDPQVGPIIQERYGMQIVLDATLYESFIKAIISQQLNLSFAETLLQRFLWLAGTTVQYKSLSLPVFPTPEKVAQLQYEELQALQFNRRKAEYIIDLSRMIVEGQLSLSHLSALSDDEVIQSVTRIRGVGRWTAECVLLFGMGRPNLLPAADIGLRNAIHHLFQTPTRPGEEEVRQLAADWAPYQSYMTFYLWDWLADP